MRYNGDHAKCLHPILEQWLTQGRLKIVCPEVAGGLSTPREPAEIEVGSSGGDVLTGQARVRERTGGDVTPEFLVGARSVVQVAKEARIRLAILKDGSPSCGSDYVADGTFSGNRIVNQGVTAAALQAAGVRVFSEHHLEEAAAFLERLELDSQKRSSQPRDLMHQGDWSI